MATITIKFRGKKAEKSIYVVYRHGYQEHRFPTGVKALPSLWDKKQKKLVYPKALAKLEGTHNGKINKVITDINLLVDQFVHEDTDPSVEAVYNAYHVTEAPEAKEPEKTKTVLELIDDYLSAIKNSLAYNTHKNRKHDLYCFRDFAKGKRITPASFDNKLYNDFKSWLRDEKKLSDNSIAAIIKTLRIYLGWLISDKRMDINTGFQKWDVKETYTDSVYLQQREFNKLLKHDFRKTPHLEAVRDRFIFQCRTGLRISDLDRFRKDVHLIDNKIQIAQQKNESFVSIPLNPVSAMILNKYKVFPHMPDAVYNEKIKKVCKIAGLNRKVETSTKKNGKPEYESKPLHEIISSHDAIRTFISHGIENGITPGVMAKITGKNIQVLLRNYYKTDAKTVDRESVRAFGKVNLKIK